MCPEIRICHNSEGRFRSLAVCNIVPAVCVCKMQVADNSTEPEPEPLPEPPPSPPPPNTNDPREGPVQVIITPDTHT